MAAIRRRGLGVTESRDKSSSCTQVSYRTRAIERFVDGFWVNPSSHVPPSVQIVEAILDALAANRFAAGAKLPSVRALAVQVLVNPNTVSKAYAELERLGVVAGRNGSGVYVTDGGPETAHALRHAATLATFVDAARAARRAGHEAGALAVALEEVALEELGEQSAVSAGDRDEASK